MSKGVSPIRIGIYGPDCAWKGERHGCGLWDAGVASCVTAAEGEPVPLPDAHGRSWDDVLDGIHGVVVTGSDDSPRRNTSEVEALAQWCRQNGFPILAIDHGMHLMNTAHGGTVHFDLPRDLPEALQHRHPPERGLRHAIAVVPDTHLAELYGDGEVVVNSEHRRAVQRVAKGFRVSARALDTVVEAIEWEKDDWYAVGVQWQPASSTASGLDIQLFRGVIDACRRILQVEPVAA
jgi:putative glutamine amidotransferase